MESAVSRLYREAPASSLPEPAHSARTFFNGYVGANLARAYSQRGLFDALSASEPKAFDVLARETSCSESGLEALLRTGVALDIVRVENGRYSLTQVGDELRHNIGFFTWAIGGYGAFFRDLSNLAGSEGGDHRAFIDGSMVALGSDQVNQAMMRTIYDEAMAGLPQFACVADLGCGNAGRLIDLCKRFPRSTGVGIDINAQAIALAKKNVEANQLSGRITLHRTNVLDAVEAEEVRHALAPVELVTCFMMLHDLFNVEAPEMVIRKLRRAFPQARCFVFADTFRMPMHPQPDELPIFSLGFELVHGVMGIRLHTPNDYVEAFRKGGLSVKEMRHFGAPNTYIFVMEVQS
jgi:SAM-dependent methyltransferase